MTDMTLDKAAIVMAMPQSQQTGRSRARSSRGVALVSTLLILMILSALGAAMTIGSQTEIMLARNVVSSAQAAAAEAGLNHATELVIPFLTGGGAMTGLIQGPDGATHNNPSQPENDDNGSLENLGIPRPPAQLALGGAFGVSYEARVFDEDDPARGVTLTAADLARIGEDGDPTTDANSTIVIQAIGYGLDNTRVTLETTIGTITTSGTGAILLGGDLTIAGDATFTGSQGGVHANGDLSISANPTIAQDATATGTYTASGNPTIGGISGGGQGSVSLPPVAAIDHRPSADFILQSDGVMTNHTGTDGTYYVEGLATISGNPGTAATPLALTVIAEASIEITGNPFLTPDTPGLMFVTDGDLSISGNAAAGEQNYEGAMLVHEQLKISGDPRVTGQIIVENAVNNSTIVDGVSEISGNATISYSGGNSFGNGGTLGLSAWREVR